MTGFEVALRLSPKTPTAPPVTSETLALSPAATPVREAAEKLNVARLVRS